MTAINYGFELEQIFHGKRGCGKTRELLRFLLHKPHHCIGALSYTALYIVPSIHNIYRSLFYLMAEIKRMAPESDPRLFRYHGFIRFHPDGDRIFFGTDADTLRWLGIRFDRIAFDDADELDPETFERIALQLQYGGRIAMAVRRVEPAWIQAGQAQVKERVEIPLVTT